MNLFGLFASKKKVKSGRLPDESFREMVSFAEEKGFRSSVAELMPAKVLEIAPRQRSLSAFFKEKGAEVTRLGGAVEQEMGTPGAAFVFSHWENFPFLDATWGAVFLRLPFLRESKGRALREAGRLVKEGGKLYLTDFHPFSLSVQKEALKSAASADGMGPGFEWYFRLFQELGLKIESVQEVFFDGSLKKFFGKEEKLLEPLRRTPFLILFGLRKESSRADR